MPGTVLELFLPNTIFKVLILQEDFMDLYLLAELKTISLKITTVDMLKPPPDFRSNFDATPPPILIDRLYFLFVHILVLL